ncbi:MAG: hypothetical protein RM338_05630 [Nostoc sp. DedQUE12a]|nr:hypothetical protein [Nostoc sp. DedQUE12a]
MSEQKPLVITKEDDILPLFPRLPILTSLQASWQKTTQNQHFQPSLSKKCSTDAHSPYFQHLSIKLWYISILSIDAQQMLKCESVNSSLFILQKYLE